MEDRSCPRDHNQSWELGFAVPLGCNSLGEGKHLSTWVLTAGLEFSSGCVQMLQGRAGSSVCSTKHSRDHMSCDQYQTPSVWHLTPVTHSWPSRFTLCWEQPWSICISLLITNYLLRGMGITMKKSEQWSSHAVTWLWWLIYSSFCHNVIFWKPAELWLPKWSVMKHPKVIPWLCREAFEQSLSSCHGVSLANPSWAICLQKCHCHLAPEPCTTRLGVPFVWDIQVQTQISLSCPRSQLCSFCGLLWNVPVRKPWQSVLNMLLFISQTAQLSEFN